MIFIYDILLNFNNDLFEFYEWNKNDIIYHIKKIPLLKVNTESLFNFINNKIKVNNYLLDLVNNKTELYNKKNKYLKYSCLLTDSYKVIGIIINEDGIVSKISDLLLDEACDTINISKRCNLIDLEYTILEKKNINYYLTRKELLVKHYLFDEINNIYKENNYSKLKYLYFEYFNRNNNDINDIYNELIDSLNNININHIRLYKLLNMTSNLTN